MYLRALVEGAARVDLGGNPAGEVSAADAEHAAAKLAEILAARQARRIAAREARQAVAVPAPAPPRPAVKDLLKDRPVLRLPGNHPDQALPWPLSR